MVLAIIATTLVASLLLLSAIDSVRARNGRLV